MLKGTASSIFVGGAVSGGTANSILFVSATGTLAQDNTNFNYTTASGPRLQVGSGSTTSMGVVLGQLATGSAGIWPTSVAPSATNYMIRLVASGLLNLKAASDESNYVQLSATAGQGPSIAAGTATTDVNALSATQTWNNAGVAFTGDTANFTNTASAVGSAVLDRKVNGGSLFRIEHYTAAVTASAGASVVATNLIPAKSQLIGIATRVTTALGESTGTTGYAVGDGTDPNRWGDVVGVAIGTSSAQANATADPSGWFGAAQSVTLTAAGGNFDGTGVIRVVASVLTMKPPTS